MQHAHRSGGPPRHRGHLIDVQPGQIAQQDDLTLVDRQGTKPGDSRVEGMLSLGLAALRRVAQLGQLCDGEGLARNATVVVEGTSPGPREEPPAERRVISAETVKPVGRLDPDVGGHVLTRVTAHRPQIAKERRVQRTPERRDRPLLPLLRGG